MDINISFCRALLKLTLAEVREAIPTAKLSDAWVYKCDRGHWEFHYQDYCWHGSADNAYEARANGWTAYLQRRNDEANAQTIAAFQQELGV